MTKRKAIPPVRTRRPGSSSATKERVVVTRYFESSALVAALLEGDVAAKASIRAAGRRVTSALTVTEVNRAVLRARRCHIVSVTEAILAHAGRPFPVEPIRTLDAIHLATAEASGDAPALVTILTREVRVRDSATALGHPVE